MWMVHDFQAPSNIFTDPICHDDVINEESISLDWVFNVLTFMLLKKNLKLLYKGLPSGAREKHLSYRQESSMTS